MKINRNVLSVAVPTLAVLLLAVARHQDGVRTPIEAFIMRIAPQASVALICSAYIIMDARQRSKDGVR